MLYIAFAALAGISYASFIQCEPEDSLESLDDLADDYGEKLGVTCESWPFYSGGFPKHPSDSSESSEDDDSSYSLLPSTVTYGDFLYGFDDEVQNTQCMETATTGYCLKWVITKQEYVESAKGGCHGRHDTSAADVITSYQVCACADDNFGAAENIANASASSTGTFCAIWACLETDAYPSDYDTYSLVMDNSFLISSSDSSDEDDEESANGNYYRFAQDGSTLALDESMEFINCWCKSASLNGKYCLNWYCESLEHDEFGCHKKGFGVDDYGWYGCVENAETETVTACQQWYGFLVDEEVRDEYRCQVGDGLTAVCGVRELPMRQNYLWHNFPLAMFLWVCLCGCCGTRCCYKNKRCNGEPKKWPKWLKCRKCRLFSFYAVFNVIALIHGGIPAWLFFNLFSLCTCWCSYKCENCKCCSSKCSWSKKWECNNTQKKSVEAAIVNTAQNTTDKDGENSKEESAPHEPVEVSSKGANKTGHVRLNSVDVDELDGDQPSV